MPGINSLLRSLPKVDELLQRPEIEAAVRESSRAQMLEAVRLVLDRLREDIKAGRLDTLPGVAELCGEACAEAQNAARLCLRPVINATGIVLHTNLGRAPLAREAARAVEDAARGYSNLEYDIQEGERGSRMSHIVHLLRRICGAEDAIVVNNNAAAVLLALTALAKGRQVIISRGELVEIGGAFRVPEVMEQSGCALVEVGTTNKTRLGDYERAVTADTGAILKVHSSNFKLVGFAESAELSDLCALAKKRGLPLIHDLGSGLLASGEAARLPGEPTVKQSVLCGADVITFSGDKLLGGPQAGIIIGRAEYIAAMKKHPLARALRIDKLTLAALEATLRLYLTGDGALEKIPVLAMLTAAESELKSRAEQLCALVASRCGADCEASAVPVEGLAGGGSAPGEGLASWAAAIEPKSISLTDLAARLRLGTPHIVGRAYQGRLLLDVRTLLPGEMGQIAERLDEIFRAPKSEALS